jgi:hypothetical protein
MTPDVVLAYNPADVKPGWVAFWIVVALCVATFFLWRSMNTQLGKIRMPPRPSSRPGIGTGTRQPVAPPPSAGPPPDDADAPPRDDDA